MKQKLSDIYELQMGKTPARKEPTYWNGSNMWVSISDLSSNGKFIKTTKECITDEGVKDSGIKSVPKGTLMMSFKLSLGKVAIADCDLYTNEAIMSFIDKGNYAVDRDYMYYQLQAIDWSRYTNKAVKGATLNKATLSDVFVKLPSLDEQKYVVEKLDKIDRLIANLNKQNELIAESVKSRFIEMFGDPLTNPHGLSVVKLKKISALITKGASPKWQGFAYSNDKSQTLFVTSENVREGFLDFTANKYIEDAFNDKQKRSILKRNDILINIVGASIGRAAKFDMERKANINQAVALVRIEDKQMNLDYLIQYLNSEKALQMYNAMKSDVARANLSLQDIGNLDILVPPKSEQDDYAKFIAQADKSKLNIQKSLANLTELRDSLLQEYFG